MDAQSKKKKSAHLKELEETFERHTRRFSPFAVLGLTPHEEEPAEPPENAEPISPPATPPPGSEIPPTGFHSPPSGSERSAPEEVPERPLPSGPDSPVYGGGPTNPPPPGSLRPTPEPESSSLLLNGADDAQSKPLSGSVGPTPGLGPSQEVVVVKNTTTQGRSARGAGVSDPPVDGAMRPPSGFLTPPSGSDGRGGMLSSSPDFHPERVHSESQDSVQASNAYHLAEVVAAVQLGNQLGKKACQVLAYLNTMRSAEYEAYTLPVGYGQISAAVGVDADYLRRKVLPKLAMLGLLAVARKSLEGTIYHLPHAAEYVKVVTEGIASHEKRATRHERQDGAQRQDTPAALPEWIDREQWGWLSGEHVRRLIEKSGSEARAREKLDIILYNETHGPMERRVRTRRSLLMHYLTAPEAEIWPNDSGFETLEIRRAIVEKEQALREKALAEEALQARQQAERLRFLASLSEEQLIWLRGEAKRRVDAQPASRLLSSRYPLYKAEEEKIVLEWMDRSAYGESMPAVQERSG
jgi:hypothetical protein